MCTCLDHFTDHFTSTDGVFRSCHLYCLYHCMLSSFHLHCLCVQIVSSPLTVCSDHLIFTSSDCMFRLFNHHCLYQCMFRSFHLQWLYVQIVSPPLFVSVYAQIISSPVTVCSDHLQWLWWWWRFPCLQGFGENVQPFIPCLLFFFFFKWRLAHIH